jgi:hypothetical protein
MFRKPHIIGDLRQPLAQSGRPAGFAPFPPRLQFPQSRAPVVLQFIGPASDDPARRMVGTLKSAICVGLGPYGASLMELYKVDLTSTDPAIQAAVAAIRSPGGCG